MFWPYMTLLVVGNVCTFTTKLLPKPNLLTQTIWTDINILSWSNKCKFRHRWQSQLVLVQTQQLIFWCGEQILWHILDALGFCSSCRYCHPGTGTQFSKARFRRGGSLSERIWIWERLVYDGKPFLMQLWWSVIECVYSCDCTHGCQGASIVIKDSSHTLITHSLIYTPNLDWHFRSLCCTICGCCNCAGFIAGIILVVMDLSGFIDNLGANFVDIVAVNANISNLTHMLTTNFAQRARIRCLSPVLWWRQSGWTSLSLCVSVSDAQ